MTKKRTHKDAAAGFAAAVTSREAPEAPRKLQEGAAPPQDPAQRPQARTRTPVTGKSVRPHSKQALVYLHPEGHRALKLYAAEADRSMQDVMAELLERGARQLGIAAPMRPEPPSS